MTYDTEKLEQAARKISQVGSDVGELSRGKVKRIRNGAQGALVGEAGTALTNQLSGLQNDMNALANGLSQVADALRKYAAELREADARASRAIKSSS